MKARLTVLFCIAVSWSYSGMAVAGEWSDENPPLEVMEAAARGLPKFLAKLPRREIAAFGFSSRDEMDEAVPGDPIPVFTIRREDLLGYNASTDILSILTPTKLWFFPVLCAGELKSLLTVDSSSGVPNAAAIGGSGLARQLGSIMHKWSAAEGYERRFVRIYEMRSDMVILLDKTGARIVPLLSLTIALALEQPENAVPHPYRPEEIMELLSSKVRSER